MEKELAELKQQVQALQREVSRVSGWSFISFFLSFFFLLSSFSRNWIGY